MTRRTRHSPGWREAVAGTRRDRQARARRLAKQRLVELLRPLRLGGRVESWTVAVLAGLVATQLERPSQDVIQEVVRLVQGLAQLARTLMPG